MWCWRWLESPLDCKEIQSVNPTGNQPWIFIGRADAEAEAPILRPPDVNSWLVGKDPDAGKDWRQKGKEKCINFDIISILLLQFSHSAMSNSATPRIVARQASLFFISWSLLKLMCAESVKHSNYVIILLVVVFQPLSCVQLLWPHHTRFHYLPGFAQTHVFWFGDVTQLYKSLLPSSHILNLF